jgi:hypothetical protein
VLAKVLEAATQEGGLGFTKASAKLRLVSAQWKTVRDALVKRLVLKKKATDEGMGVLVRRFPAMVSLEFKWVSGGHALTDEGLCVVSCLTSLNELNLTDCVEVTDKGVRALSSCTALTSLNLTWCYELTDVGVQALSSLPALTSLDLRGCSKVTASGLQALRNTTVAPSLQIQR